MRNWVGNVHEMNLSADRTVNVDVECVFVSAFFCILHIRLQTIQATGT